MKLSRDLQELLSLSNLTVQLLSGTLIDLNVIEFLLYFFVVEDLIFASSLSLSNLNVQSACNSQLSFCACKFQMHVCTYSTHKQDLSLALFLSCAYYFITIHVRSGEIFSCVVGKFLNNRSYHGRLFSYCHSFPIRFNRLSRLALIDY